MSNGSGFPKQLGAMERLAVDLGNLAVAAIEFGEALQKMVAVGSTAGANPKFEIQFTEAGKSASEKANAFEKVLVAIGDPHGRAMRDMETIRGPVH